MGAFEFQKILYSLLFTVRAGMSTEGTTTTTTTDGAGSNSAASGTDYYTDPNQYYYGYDYSTGAYTDASAGYVYDAASQQYYYDPNYYAQYYGNAATATAAAGTSSSSHTATPPTAASVKSTPSTAIPRNTISPIEAATQQATYNPAMQAMIYNPQANKTASPAASGAGAAGSSNTPPAVSTSGYTGPNAKNEPEEKSKKKKKAVVRSAAGEVWEDPTLQEWDDNDFRLFAGDLGNEVTDELLFKAFSKYPSLQRTRVVRDKRTGKTRGYGFLSFKDPNDFVKAWREMNGKTRPYTLMCFYVEVSNMKGD